MLSKCNMRNIPEYVCMRVLRITQHTFEASLLVQLAVFHTEGRDTLAISHLRLIFLPSKFAHKLCITTIQVTFPLQWYQVPLLVVVSKAVILYDFVCRIWWMRSI